MAAPATEALRHPAAAAAVAATTSAAAPALLSLTVPAPRPVVRGRRWCSRYAPTCTRGTRVPILVTISYAMVSAATAHSSAVGSPVARPEQHRFGARLGPVTLQVDDELVHRHLPGDGPHPAA